MSYSREVIQKEYERLGYSKGWSFLAVPEANIGRAKVAIVGLNPGGGGEGDNYPYGSLWDSPEGNAYFLEKWRPGETDSPLQKQVKAWHSLLGVSPNDTLCAQLVPFRSPNWGALERKSEALAFAKDLWTWLLCETSASLFITMGKTAGQLLSEITGARLVGRGLPTGWEGQTIDVYDTSDGRRIVAMPHPARFTLFERGEASEVAERSFRAAAGLDAEGATLAR